MYCPSDDCPDFVRFGERGEYQEGVATCPRCGARLAPGDPPGDPETVIEGAEPLASVASFQFPHQAQVAVSVLASNGIVAVVTGDDCGRADPILGVVTGGVRVMVRESQAREALALLESVQAPGAQGGV